MSAAGDSIRERVTRGDRFSLEEVTRCAVVRDDLDLWSALYEALGTAYHRIDPEPGMAMACSFMVRYLLWSVRENPPSSNLGGHSGYEAAWELAACLKFWSKKLPETGPILQIAEHEMAANFISGDQEMRDRLLNGCLEHALESAAVRPFFSHWARDSQLSEAWRLAMEWAVAHGDPEME